MAMSEMAISIVHELKMFIQVACYKDDIPLDEFIESIPTKFEGINKFLEGKRWLAGDHLSIPDFELVELLELCDYLTKGEIYEINSNFKEYRNRFYAIKSIKAYRESDRFPKQWPFNNKHARIGGNWGESYHKLRKSVTFK